MQLSDFKIPFGWEERRPVFLEKSFYLPPALEEHGERLDFSRVFAIDRPIAIEYCSGNGHWILNQAQMHPQINWIAVEKDFERARKTWLKIVRSGLDNLFLVCGEALTFTRHYIPDSSIAEVYVNFPDPWPKRRHQKHRLIQKAFVDELARIGFFNLAATVVTDDVDYSQQVIEAFSSWRSAFGKEPFVTEWPDGYGLSTFSELWHSKGRKIRYHRFIRGH